MNNLITLNLRIPRETEVTPLATQTFLSSLLGINKRSSFNKILGKEGKPISLEIVLSKSQIYFQITADKNVVDFIETQLLSSYPVVVIQKQEVTKLSNDIFFASANLKSGSYYPIKTFPDFTEIDSLSSVLSILSKANENDIAIIQYNIEAVSSSWQSKAQDYAAKGTKKEDGTYSPRSDQAIIIEKTKTPGFNVSIRIASNNQTLLQKISQSFNVFNRADGNEFVFSKPTSFNRNGFIKDFNDRKVKGGQIFNIEEIATLWHLPSEDIKTTGIAWQAKVISEPPHNLPTAKVSEAEKENINFFARTIFKNEDVIFGIKDLDHRRHVWAIGKTGTGKSTLIANMVIDDIKKGKGVAIIDPHGDLSETILNYIPKNRINDVIYFNPAEKEYPIVLNPLEVSNKEETELMVSGIISIFSKIFGEHWGPRIEYILRNSLLTLAEVPDSTLTDVPMLLTNSNYRKNLVDKLKDPVVKSFWEDEYENMPIMLQKEAISPILNKVGRFVTSPMVRRIIGSPKSSIKIDDIMNEGKILIVNLSQGRLGEDNAALLGAMIITKIQLAAMHRVDIPESERKDFYLYVDEFQNFATGSFIKILSEARKYHLNITLVNQYISQIPTEVQKAVLGNAGTIISFAIGAEDARILFHEFAEVFKETDLVSLLNYQIAVKLMIDGHSQRPFLANTLPLPAYENNNKETIFKVSKERWGRKAKED